MTLTAIFGFMAIGVFVGIIIGIEIVKFVFKDRLDDVFNQGRETARKEAA